LEVVEQAAPEPDHLEQPATRVVILRVGLQVLGEVRDPLRQQGDLDLGGTGVALVLAVAGDGVLLAYGRNGHVPTSSCVLARSSKFADFEGSRPGRQGCWCAAA